MQNKRKASTDNLIQQPPLKKLATDTGIGVMPMNSMPVDMQGVVGGGFPNAMGGSSVGKSNQNQENILKKPGNRQKISNQNPIFISDVSALTSVSSNNPIFTFKYSGNQEIDRKYQIKPHYFCSESTLLLFFLLDRALTGLVPDVEVTVEGFQFFPLLVTFCAQEILWIYLLVASKLALCVASILALWVASILALWVASILALWVASLVSLIVHFLVASLLSTIPRCHLEMGVGWCGWEMGV
ncbi:hypothetical protein SLA2020_243840 [Shorea laevis]